MVLDDKFSQEGQKDNIVGKTTSSRKLWGAQLTREVDLGAAPPSPTLSYVAAAIQTQWYKIVR